MFFDVRIVSYDTALHWICSVWSFRPLKCEAFKNLWSYGEKSYVYFESRVCFQNVKSKSKEGPPRWSKLFSESEIRNQLSFPQFWRLKLIKGNAKYSNQMSRMTHQKITESSALFKTLSRKQFTNIWIHIWVMITQ